MRKALGMVTVALVCTALAACGGGNKGFKLGDKHKVGDDATLTVSNLGNVSQARPGR